jgi:hypothetical protein
MILCVRISHEEDREPRVESSSRRDFGSNDRICRFRLTPMQLAFELAAPALLLCHGTMPLNRALEGLSQVGCCEGLPEVIDGPDMQAAD